jgi:hypothetical protein
MTDAAPRRSITIPADRLRQMRVWILVPCAGSLLTSTTAQCIFALQLRLKELGVSSTLLCIPGDSAIARARNNLADMFMAQSAPSDSIDADRASDSHFSLWIDSDLRFDADDIISILAHDLDFAAFPYTRKGINWERIGAAARAGVPDSDLHKYEGNPNVNWIAHPVLIYEPMPVIEAGNGGLLLKRRVYERMQAAYPQWRYPRTTDEQGTFGRPDAWAYFQEAIDDNPLCPPDRRIFLSEDWWFCRHWITLGGTIYCCFWVRTEHIGTYHYHLNMPAISDLLARTGGFINGPSTAPKEATNDQATPEVPRDSDDRHSGAGASADAASAGESGNRANGANGAADALSRILSDLRAPVEAAIPGD